MFLSLPIQNLLYANKLSKTLKLSNQTKPRLNCIYIKLHQLFYTLDLIRQESLIYIVKTKFKQVMKNKISFTSVLKNKTGSGQFNSTSQYSTETQNRHQRLIDIYQQFELNPDQDYTLDLKCFRNIAHRPRTSSINMMKSRNVNEDPQMDLESWIQSKKIKQNTQSFTKVNYPQKGFKVALNAHQQNIPGRKSKSNLKRNQYPQPECQQQQNNHYQTKINNVDYRRQQNQPQPLEQSGSSNQQHSINIKKTPSINYRSQNVQYYEQPQQIIRQEARLQESSKVQAGEYFSAQQLRARTNYPQLEDQQYERLKEQFQKLKQEKIAELCMHTKKSVKKQKIQQVISRALENIYQDIETMAQQIIRQKLKPSNQASNKPSEQESQQMLISASHRSNGQEDYDPSQSQSQRRQQQMKNMIKCYISGFQQAKSQIKSTSVNQEPQLQHSFHQENTFNNQIRNQPLPQPYQQQVMSKCSSPMESVGYSFSNSNMICEHSFNKQFSPHNNGSDVPAYNQSNFQKDKMDKPIHQPQKEESQYQQRICLPDIQEVESESGDIPVHQQQQVVSSQGIQLKRRKHENPMQDLTGKNIKNIQSVHYQPPNQQVCNQYYNQSNQTNTNSLFSNFQKPVAFQDQLRNSSQNWDSPSNPFQLPKLRQQDVAAKTTHSPKFVSKTFNSYLTGQMRSEYGQNVGNQQNNNLNESYNQQGTKMSPMTKLSPHSSIQHPYESTVNQKNKALQQNIKLPSPQTTKNHSNFNKFSNEKSNKSQFSSSNRSVNYQKQVSRQKLRSPQNQYEIDSKNKLNTNSPIMKIDQIIQDQQKKCNEATNITEFVGSNSKVQTKKIINRSRGSSCAIRSPIGDHKVNQSFQQKSQQKIVQNKYAFAESIIPHDGTTTKTHQFYYKNQAQSHRQRPGELVRLSQNNLAIEHQPTQSIQRQQKVSKNSILSMQPLKLSIGDSFSSKFGSKASFVQNIQYKTQQNLKNQLSPNSRRQSAQIYVRQSQRPINQMHYNKTQTINSGRNLLQYLNTKQSIQLYLPSDRKEEAFDMKTSFINETFRPSACSNYRTQQTTAYNYQQSISPSQSIPPSNGNKMSVNPSQSITSSNGNKIPITKITLKSSSSKDKNQLASPKVISLIVNHLNQKNEPLKEFSTNSSHNLNEKQNIFHKLSIRDSVNFESINKDQNNKNTAFIAHQQPINNSQTYGALKTSNHVDLGSKQNNNTLNQSQQKRDCRNQTIKFDLNQNHQMKMSASSNMNKTLTLQEKKEPLLKLSKNLTESISQHQGNGFGVKKSVGQSIRTKINQPGCLLNSKTRPIGNSIRQSFKGSVKQSIGGNEQDMDFDLELD